MSSDSSELVIGYPETGQIDKYYSRAQNLRVPGYLDVAHQRGQMPGSVQLQLIAKCTLILEGADLELSGVRPCAHEHISDPCDPDHILVISLRAPARRGTQAVAQPVEHIPRVQVG